MGYEAFITYQVQRDNTVPKLDPQNFEHRDTVKKNMNGVKNYDYKLLNNLRNALAHGIRSSMGEVTSIMSNKEKLDTELNRLFKTLLPKESK